MNKNTPRIYDQDKEDQPVPRRHIGAISSRPPHNVDGYRTREEQRAASLLRANGLAAFKRQYPAAYPGMDPIARAIRREIFHNEFEKEVTGESPITTAPHKAGKLAVAESVNVDVIASAESGADHSNRPITKANEQQIA